MRLSAYCGDERRLKFDCSRYAERTTHFVSNFVEIARPEIRFDLGRTRKVEEPYGGKNKSRQPYRRPQNETKLGHIKARIPSGFCSCHQCPPQISDLDPVLDLEGFIFSDSVACAGQFQAKNTGLLLHHFGILSSFDILFYCITDEKQNKSFGLGQISKALI
jgi:hypothetical protein